MKPILAADIGGTNSRLRLSDPDAGRVLKEQIYPSADFSSFDLILEEFLQALDDSPDTACFALAGPVHTEPDGRQTSQVTKLPWRLDSIALARRHGLRQVILLNDFEAIGHALPALRDQDRIVLQHGEPQTGAIQAVIGAGTGLGQAIVIPGGHGIQVLATEGGHTDFAAQTGEQDQLLAYVRESYEHVSFDRLVSGGGLAIIYRFLQAQLDSAIPDAIRDRLAAGRDPAPAISALALDNQDPTARRALELFLSLYGAQAGNLALNCLPTGGLFIAGGIAARIRAAFDWPPFLQAFHHKGRMQALMQRFPLYLITHPQPGLLGAAQVATTAARG